MMQAQLDARKALQPATEALYKALNKALTPERRERADAVLLLLGSTSGEGIFER
jgi:hypothetical protein